MQGQPSVEPHRLSLCVAKLASVSKIREVRAAAVVRLGDVTPYVPGLTSQ
jgi:hypothetical protein